MRRAPSNRCHTRSGVLASALAMDKIMSKQLFVASDVRTPEFITVERSGGIGAATRGKSADRRALVVARMPGIHSGKA